MLDPNQLSVNSSVCTDFIQKVNALGGELIEITPGDVTCTKNVLTGDVIWEVNSKENLIPNLTSSEDEREAQEIVNKISKPLGSPK